MKQTASREDYTSINAKGSMCRPRLDNGQILTAGVQNRSEGN